MKRILVIEDAADIRDIIAETLRLKGWEPLLAPDGEVGITLANSQVPDLVLCDIRMPKMDGYAVLQKIRSTPATATVPFVFLTGLGERPQIRQGMELGADDYLLKPFTPRELIGAIEARLQKQAVLTESAEQKIHELRESLSFALPHELGTPLNTILGFSSLIAESPSLSLAEIREYASFIQNSGERLRDLIEKFLLYAQLELMASDPLQLKGLATRPPAPTRDTVITSAEKAAQHCKRLIDFTIEAAEVEHRVGAAHLERMIRELVSNACNFSEAGQPVKITSGKKGAEFFVRVLDRGKGFSTDQISRVNTTVQFDRRLQEQQGVGLGLAITRKLAELYGGSLQILSIPGQETSVSIYLPL